MIIEPTITLHGFFSGTLKQAPAKVMLILNVTVPESTLTTIQANFSIYMNKYFRSLLFYLLLFSMLYLWIPKDSLVFLSPLLAGFSHLLERFVYFSRSVHILRLILLLQSRSIFVMFFWLLVVFGFIFAAYLFCFPSLAVELMLVIQIDKIFLESSPLVF